MKREYGIDLLKIVAMLMVVMLHIMGRGGVNEACAQNANSLRNMIEQIAYAFCVPAVDCFVLATGYIMSRHRFRYSRIVKLWCEVVFYTLCMTACAAICCPWVSVVWRDWVTAFFPIAKNSYWFLTMYVALFFSIPYLNHLLNTLPDRDLGIMIVSGFVMFSFYPALVGADLFRLHGGYSYLWFMYLYLVAGCIACRGKSFYVKPQVLVVMGMLLPIFSFALQSMVRWFSERFAMSFGTWGGYSSPEVFAQAVVMLLLFSRVKDPPKWICKVIGFAAPGVFSVYVLHSNSIFRKMVCWNGRFASLAELGIVEMLMGIFCYAAAIFVICIMVDWLRRKMMGTIYSVCIKHT